MKLIHLNILAISLSFILIITYSASAQINIDLKKKIEKKVNKELNDATDDAIDETVETVKKGGGEETENTQTENSQINSDSNTDNETIPSNDGSEEKSSEELVIWSKYDFVPGEKIIFVDDLSGEESGEFPSRWDLLSGGAEIASLGGENVIHFSNTNSIIVPLMDKKDFLPDVFTIEFDVFFEKDAPARSDFYAIRFFEGTS